MGLRVPHPAKKMKEVEIREGGQPKRQQNDVFAGKKTSVAEKWKMVISSSSPSIEEEQAPIISLSLKRCRKTTAEDMKQITLMKLKLPLNPSLNPYLL